MKADRSNQSEVKLFGSVIIKDHKTGDSRVAFIQPEIEGRETTVDTASYGIQQCWQVEYPLVAYKTFTPINNEIAIHHLAQDMPQLNFDLGEIEFISFVKHS